jgi:hypothetical protein
MILRFAYKTPANFNDRQYVLEYKYFFAQTCLRESALAALPTDFARSAIIVSSALQLFRPAQEIPS